LELGRYRLDEQVGQGGMAVVWRGWDTQLRRTVAVKVLHAHLNAREEIRKRFDREAHAVARLHHPFILDVYDFSGPLADPSYLVTEFIRGQTLRVFAEAHPFDPPELAAACLLPIAEALQHAHQAGVVHRDLKPENVMVRDDGVVKLTDFGIAALLDPDEKFTMTGSILGSPAHLAPETIEGKPVDPRADLFSFGTILYWLSCGQLPYQAPSPAALLRNILEGKRQDPRTIRPSVSDAQARIIARCLENDPAKRYQSASEVRRELEVLLREAGLDDPLRVFVSFVQNPQEHAVKVRERLVARSLAVGEEQLRRGGKTSAALAAFGRALALDPVNVHAKNRVERIRRRDQLLKLGRRVLLVAAVAAVVALGAWQARAALEHALRQREKRLTAAALQTPRPATAPATTQHPAPPKKSPPEKIEKVVAQAAPQPLPIKLHARFGAHLSIDGRDEGDNNMFQVKLVPGVHKVLVHHPCCADAQQELLVTPNRDLYQLKYGAPLPARFRVINAPPGARVLVDGVLVGTAADPPPYAMTQPDQKATVTIGDRMLHTTLKAGVINPLDYAQASP
jgi:serine/threonine-protein kinase